MTERHEYQDSERPELLPFLPTEVRTLLDVGCHRGAFGYSAKRSNQNLVVWGIEPNPAAADVARRRLDNVIQGSWPADMTPGARFDCLAFNDVLEHLADPWSALRAAHSHLKTGGRVLASVPNIRRVTLLEDLVLRGRWTYADEGLLDRTHLRFFTKSSVQDLFRDAGFAVEEVHAVGLLGGRKGTLLRRLGPLGEELRALQWVVVARSLAEQGPHVPDAVDPA